jgi:DNA-binding MarR family transcriptional regulator
MAEFGQFISAALAEASGDADVVDNQSIMVLIALDLEGPQRPGDLRDRTGLSSGGVTKVVDRLQDKGLVSRTYGAIPEDLRGVLIELTNTGRRFVQAITQALADHIPESTALERELDRLLPE